MLWGQCQGVDYARIGALREWSRTYIWKQNGQKVSFMTKGSKPLQQNVPKFRVALALQRKDMPSSFYQRKDSVTFGDPCFREPFKVSWAF